MSNITAALINIKKNFGPGDSEIVSEDEEDHSSDVRKYVTRLDNDTERQDGMTELPSPTSDDNHHVHSPAMSPDPQVNKFEIVHLDSEGLIDV